VNPLEMTNAYATLANDGMRFWATPFVEVKNPGGRVDQSIARQGEQVLDPNDAELVTYALRGVVTGGTGYAASIPPYVVAGKTGTANENVDAWFCGYTVQIVTCVWMGWPEGEIPLQNIEGVSSVFGGTIPAAIWHDYMTVAMEGQTPETFSTPSFTGYTIGPETPVVVSPSPSPSESPSEEPSPKPSASVSSTPSATPSGSSSPSPSASGAPSQ
jgi:penicillin-binding protein 1A